MDSSTVGAIVRSVLTTLGGSLVASGYLGADDLNSLVGAVVVLGTLGWSIFQKKSAKAKEVEAAKTGTVSK